MSIGNESLVHGDATKAQKIDEIMEESDRYSKVLRQRERDDQRQGAVLYLALVVVISLTIAFWVWITH